MMYVYQKKKCNDNPFAAGCVLGAPPNAKNAHHSDSKVLAKQLPSKWQRHSTPIPMASNPLEKGSWDNGIYMWGFPEMGIPQNGSFMRETPMDDLGVALNLCGILVVFLGFHGN